MRRSLRPAALSLALLGAAAAFAQETAVAPADTAIPQMALHETVDAALGTIEVVVTDRDGTPIGGLGVADFALSVDGQPAVITQVIPPAAANAPLTLAVFLDEASLEPNARSRALTDLFEALDHELLPGDRMVLASGRGGDLELLLAPTADRQAMHAALAAALAHPPVSARASELRQLRSALASSTKPAEGGGDDRMQQRLSEVDRTTILGEIRQYVAHRESESRAAIAAVGRLVDGLAGVGGARAVVVLSGGLSTRPGEGPLAAWMNRFQSAAMRDAEHRPQFEQRDSGAEAALTQLGERAARAGVRLYGLGLVESGIGTELQGGPALPQQRDSDRSDVGESLALLAGATGGVAVDGAGAARTMARGVCRDRAGAYTLAWSPLPSGGTPPTAKAKLAVTVRDEREVVRYARTASQANPVERLRDRTVGALLFGGGENPLEIALQIDPENAAADAAPAAAGQRTLQLLVTVPLARLTLVPEGRVHTGALIVMFGALDAEGRLAAVDATAVPIRIANDQLVAAFGGQASYRARLTVRAMAQRLAVSVRDQVAGIGSTVLAAWSPETPAAGAPPGGQ